MVFQANWSAIGATFDVIGTVLIGITVLLVHRHVMKEHKIDKDVLKEMRYEQAIGVSGIALIITGYFIQILIR